MEATATAVATPPAPSPVTFEIAYPENLSRGKVLLKVLLGWAYVGIPHGVMLTLYSLATSVVTFIAFWIILFTGHHPRGLFNFVLGQLRWQSRVAAYMDLMRDEYPPFNGRP